MIPESKWKWFGNAAHFILGDRCRFHLATQVGDYLVSTVGQLWSSQEVQRIHAQSLDPAWYRRNAPLRGDPWDAAYLRRFGFEEIGYRRTFETGVFRAGKPCDSSDCGCGLPAINGDELEMSAYNDAGSATRGHLAMCRKWARKKLTASKPSPGENEPEQ